MVDSAIFQKEVRDVAEFLYVLLTDAVIARNAPALIVACNKQGNSAPLPGLRAGGHPYSQVCLSCRCHNGKICKTDSAAAGKGIVSDISPFISVQKRIRRFLYVEAEKRSVSVLKLAFSVLLRNTLRVTRSAALSSQDGSVGGSVYLGKKGRDFEFSQLQMKVEFLECSARGTGGDDADIGNLERSLAKL